MIKSLRSKPIRLIAIAVVPLALLGTACGSDSDGDNDSPANTEASSDAPADTDGGEESSSNPDVETFCNEVDDFVESFNKVMADPSSGDVGELTTQAQELVSAGTDLAGSVEGDDRARLEECTKSLSDLSGG